MKIGEVVHIRLNPEDVMGVIDVVKNAGVYMPGMSLAQITRLALSGLLEAARKHEVIPRREGFEYSTMVQPILQSGRNGKKLQITNIVEEAEAARAVLDKPATPVNISLERQRKGANDLFDELATLKGRKILRQQELEFKRSADPMNFTPDEQMQLDGLNRDVSEIDSRLDEISKEI